MRNLKENERYYWVTVPNKWDFENTKVKSEIYKNENGSSIFEGNNVFLDEKEAIKKANEIRQLWNYPKINGK